VQKFICFASSTLVLGLVFGTANAAADLVGWWTFDDESAGIALDSSGYERHGSFGGDPQFVS